jgi:23S rRNA U2552 (ribose-2'-O)-methylase RlmE/FtsJ
VQGARQGYRSTRTELGEALPAAGVDAVLDAYRTEGRRLVDTARAVELVSRALRGEVFVPRMRAEAPRKQPE